MQREFRQKFGDDRQRGAAPSRKIIGQWVRQWRETGSVQVKPRTLTYLTVFSCIYCCVQKMCYPAFKMGNVKCRTLYIYI